MDLEEIWRDVPNYEKLYMISTYGRIRSFYYKTTPFLRPKNNGHDYLYVQLYKNGVYKIFYIHRLVAMVYIPIPQELLDQGYTFETLEINHKDEDSTNNRVENLEWCTRKYNANYGTAITRATEKLSFPVTCFDRKGNFIKSYPSMREAARQTGEPESTIWKCIRGIQSCSNQFIWYPTEKEYELGYQLPPEKLKLYGQEHHYKPVTCFDKNGNFIGNYKSCGDAAQQLHCTASAINICSNGSQKFHNGMIFKATKPEYGPDYKLPLEEIPLTHLEQIRKKVAIFDMDGFFLRSFNSIKEAALYCDLSPATVSNAIIENRCLKRKYIVKILDKEYKEGDNLYQIDELDLSRIIIQKTPYSNKFLASYTNVFDAYRHLFPMDKVTCINGWQRIIFVCKGIMKVVYGYKWEFGN